MIIGRRSLLFGCHQFVLHPLFTAAGWIKLYGRPGDMFLWLAFIIHDWGYWGMRVIDGDDDDHPRIMVRKINRLMSLVGYYRMPLWLFDRFLLLRKEIFLHSRSFSKTVGRDPSRLCWADKLGTAMMPSWLWAALALASGEGFVYLDNARYEMYSEKKEPHTFMGLYSFHQKYKKFIYDCMAIRE